MRPEFPARASARIEGRCRSSPSTRADWHAGEKVSGRTRDPGFAYRRREARKRLPMTNLSPHKRAQDTRVLLIPLSELSVHEHNVRRTDKRADIETLAASIEAHGLLQNLTVVEQDGGRHGVVAGGRRLAALKLLAKQGRIARDYAAPCTLIAEDAAHEASLAENVQRVAMNVMDEVEAFAGLVDGGASAEDVARRFGCTIRHVAQRLALARLSPKIRAAYRRGDVTLDVARAFCLGSDHAAQERVFKQLGKPITHAHSVRTALTQGRVSFRDRIALFVGVEPYEAAGGRIVRDLFEDGVVFLEDGELLHRLAQQRLETVRAAELTDGWSWAEVTTGRGVVDGCASERLQPSQRRLTAAEKRQIAETRANIERLDAALEEVSDDDDNPMWAERDAAEERIGALQEQAKVWDRRHMAHAGVALSIDHDGRLVITRGLIKRTAMKALNKLRNAPALDDDRSEDETTIPSSASMDGDASNHLPKALARTLTTARTRALRAELAQQPHVALALLVHALSQARIRASLAGVGISSRPIGFDDADFASLQGNIDVAAWRDCLAAPADLLLDRLAILVAETLDLTHEGAGAADHRIQSVGDQIAVAIGLDMTRYWTSDEAFWMRAPKPLALAALETAPQIAALPVAERAALLVRSAKMKKAELAAVTAQVLEGVGWLPELLITPLDAGALALTDAGHAELTAADAT